MKVPPRTPEFEKTELFKQLKAEMQAAGKAELPKNLLTHRKRTLPTIRLVVNKGKTLWKK